MISLNVFMQTVIYLLVLGLIVWLLYWLIGVVNPPEPFRKVATVVLAILSVLAVVTVLMGLVTGRHVFVP